MSSVLCATIDDEPRIREIIQEMIDTEKVTSYKAFTSESKKKKEARKKKADREAKMAEKMAEELGLKTSADGYINKVLLIFYVHNKSKSSKYRGEDSLRALIQKRNADRAASADNFFSSLEAKYGGKATKKKQTVNKRKQKKESEDEDEEEEKTSKRTKKGRVSKK